MPLPVAALMQAEHLVVVDIALVIQVAGVEQLGQRHARLAVGHARGQHQLAEDAAEGDVAFVGEAGVPEDADAMAIHGGHDLGLDRGVQRLCDIHAGYLGAERMQRLDGQGHGVSCGLVLPGSYTRRPFPRGA